MKLPNEQILEQAADKLTELAKEAARDMEENSFWGPAGEDRMIWRSGFVNGFGGPAGELGGALHPRVCLAIAESWRQMAEFARMYKEMADDHDRSACEDHTCGAMGLAIESARTFLNYS